MIKAIVVDDEKNSRENLVKLLNNFVKDVNVVAEADSAQSGAEKIKELLPDVVFLDIEMPHGSDFDLLKSFEKIDFEVIFVTAYNHYAIKAIKFSALDYLLKPVDIQELALTIERVKQKNKIKNNDQINILIKNLESGSDKQLSKIVLPTLDGFEIADISEVIRCEGQGNYTNIYLTSKELPVLVSKTLKDYDNLLSGFYFFRIHQSHLVNLKHIRKYIRGRGGEVVMKDGTTLDVARSKKDSFIKLFNK